MSSARLLVKLALRACERGDLEGASEALRGVLALEQPTPSPTQSTLRVASITELARVLGYSPRHVRGLIARGEIPADALLGGKRARRILVDRALEALRLSATTDPAAADEIEREGTEYVQRRTRLRVIDKKGEQR